AARSPPRRNSWRRCAKSGWSASSAGRSPRVSRRLPRANLVTVCGVVLGHHRRDIAEHDGPDALLRAAAHPGVGVQRAEGDDVRAARRTERGETGRERARGVVALARDSGAIEIRQLRLRLLQQAADARAIALALEIGEVPALRNGRERAVWPRRRGFVPR